MRVHVIHNPHAMNPLPVWVFSAPTDKQIIASSDGWMEFQSPPARVTHEEIAKRAYEFFQRRGRGHGMHLDDWLRAEAAAREEIARW